MVKKRLIFVLYYFDGYFYLSRNFVLQKVGDVKWLMDKFHFSNIANYVDELVIFNVDRDRESFKKDRLFKDLEILFKHVFVPFSIGGGIQTNDVVNDCFRFGCDKIVFNSAFIDNKDLVNYTIDNFGKQAVVVNVDYKITNQERMAYIHNGSEKSVEMREMIDQILKYNPGELILNCMTLDGTGMGFDMAILEYLNNPQIPVIISGGAGKPEHFVELLKNKDINAVATGNLFNFLGSGFKNVRSSLIDSGLNVRKF